MERTDQLRPALRLAIALALTILAHDLLMTAGTHASIGSGQVATAHDHHGNTTPLATVHPARTGAAGTPHQVEAAGEPHAPHCASLRAAVTRPVLGDDGVIAVSDSPHLPTTLPPIPSRPGHWQPPHEPPATRRARFQVYRI